MDTLLTILRTFPLRALHFRPTTAAVELARAEAGRVG